MNFRVFRTCHITGIGSYYSKQYPCNFTLRMVAGGKGIYRMKNTEWEIEYGDIFIASPGIPIEFFETAGTPLEWYEFQLEGSGAFETLYLSGCTNDLPVRKIDHPEKTIRLFHMLHNYFAKTDRRIFRAQALFWRLMDSLLPENSEHASQFSHPYEILVQKAKILLNNSHFAISQNVEEIAARYFSVDRSTLFRAFRKVEGVSPKAYLQDIRLNKARELLMTTNMPLADIALASGLQNEKYFINFFRKNMGVPPERWRKEQRMKKSQEQHIPTDQ